MASSSFESDLAGTQNDSSGLREEDDSVSEDRLQPSSFRKTL